MYEGSFSTRLSELLISTNSFVCAESVSAGVELRSDFSVSIDPLQFINAMVSITAIILNSRQVGSTPNEKCAKVRYLNPNAMHFDAYFQIGQIAYKTMNAKCEG
jgi:hypothetical protein